MNIEKMILIEYFKKKNTTNYRFNLSMQVAIKTLLFLQIQSSFELSKFTTLHASCLSSLPGKTT